MDPRPHVALFVETSITYGREILRGITRYLQFRQPWSVFVEQRDRLAMPPDWLRRWKGQGVILRRSSPELIRMLLRKRVAVVDLDDRQPTGKVARIESDHRAIGRLGAEHLRERGFRQFAFCGFENQHWSTERREGFVHVLRHHGLPCIVLESKEPVPWEVEQDRLGKWLLSLPRPVGLMTSNDVRGQQVLDACMRVGLAVPEVVAVLGVDNNEILCNLCHRPLSSVAPNAELIGFEAAATLDRLMAGVSASELHLLIEPKGVITRQSTDILAIDDAEIAGVVRFIREQSCRGCSMSDVMRHTRLSRSLLERRFRRSIGHSPQAEIRAIQIKRVKEMLSGSDLSLADIAGIAGYRHPEYMSVVFKRETGQTPGEYRKAQQTQ